MSVSVLVEIQNPYQIKSLPSLRVFELWCTAALQSEAVNDDGEYKETDETKAISVLIRVVNEVESAELNQSFRQKEGPTNILSFENQLDEILLGIPELAKENQHLGDLIVCAPVLEQEALTQQKSSTDHWAHLLVHGMLHLQGFDHIQEKDAEVMEYLEIKILESLGIKNPYQARSL